jgi:hypothetical protein
VVYDLIHRRILDKLSRWTWHMVLNNAAERVNAATCILTSATSLRSLRIPGSAREDVASAGVLAAAASAAGHSLERLVARVHKSDYLAIAQVGRFHALRMMHVVWVPRALENWALKDLPGWDLPNLTDVEWIFKRIGAGVGAHSHLAFLARSRLPRLRRVRLVLRELAEEHVDELARFFARHPHCYRFEAIFSAPKVVLPLFPHIAACELFIRGVPSVTGAICMSPAVRHLTIETHTAEHRDPETIEDFVDALARSDTRGTLETLRLCFMNADPTAQYMLHFAWFDTGKDPRYTAFVTAMRKCALRLEHLGIALLDEYGETHELVTYSRSRN